MPLEALPRQDGFHAKRQIVILDDFGIPTMTLQSRSDLLEVIDGRAGNRFTIVTSQIPIDRWHEYLSGGTQPVLMRSLIVCSVT